MILRSAAVAALSTVAFITVAPPAQAAGSFQTITRDGVSIKYQRVAQTGTPVSGQGTTKSDFDGDGLDDIAAAARGGVIVRYSSKRWVDYFGNTTGESALTLGTALTSADFNSDGYDDLVMADPAEKDAANGTFAGGLWIVPGSAQGLAVAPIRHLNQGSTGVPGTSGPGDEFGGALAAGDLNGDGRPELAVGIPGKDLDVAKSAGFVLLFPGTASGIGTTGVVTMHQNSTGMPDNAEDWERFGSALAIGRFSPDSYADLAIATPGEDSRDATQETKGMVNMVFGSASGPRLSGVSSIYGSDYAADYPGITPVMLGLGGLAFSDTNGDGGQDLVIGVPKATVDGQTEAGAIVTVLGNRDAFTGGEVQYITQNSEGVPGGAEKGDSFGSAVAGGDVSGDGYGDVIVGVPGEDTTAQNEGVLTLLRGTATGVAAGVSQTVGQGAGGTPGPANRDDFFGHDVEVLNLDGQGGLDAIVTASSEQDGQALDDSFGSVTTYTGGDPNFMRGLSRTTGNDLRITGFDTNIYGYVL
ncbi:MAG: FG-GAP and VCBS repeat-containing protein [Actinoplanes sp.]